MHVMWNRGKRKSPLFQILALLASRRRSDRPNRVLRVLLQFICFLWFYILFLSLFDSSDCTVFTIFFVRHSLFASHYLYLLLRPFQSFYFSVYDHLVVSNQIVGCIPGLHSGWHFRGYLLKHWFLKHWFRSAQNIKFDYTDNAQLQPFYKRAFIESLPAGKPTGAAVDSCCTL